MRTEDLQAVAPLVALDSAAKALPRLPTGDSRGGRHLDCNEEAIACAVVPETREGLEVASQCFAMGCDVDLVGQRI